ncbi:hypothetical protein LBMAG56_46670 [Verrucomicrobiota bacterium]|nr:hypothetical protein LBMAG56_46670 [Verrucomicrobiota bacterium]
MRTAVPEKIQKIIADIDKQGNASLTRLTVLKKWFEHPGRLSVFGLWIARRAAGRKGKTKGEAGALLDETRALLGTASTRESYFQAIDREAAMGLHDRARAFHNEYQNQQWGPVRVIHCWPLLLVEKGLALHTGLTRHPSDGYKLAADWAQNYDSKYGSGLNGPSRGKLDELVQFLFNVEAVEDHP